MVENQFMDSPAAQKAKEEQQTEPKADRGLSSQSRAQAPGDRSKEGEDE